ncbi:transcriptional regulator [Alkalihalobacillus alcalophilus ATCC 27647 = CGMCC 1.3604]|uniref:Transcriptional regulator n=1 Tax=Alkalihalobacillus alcalophilus ATCC 27647 = CGMCC 1.3604 TaxID=1218173 RepID=A0A4S4K028_ALKAL|nr:LCP family protein [Alkalihalobacillus alcalophilus]MED1561681.1 LCP family protein [Alkalihalobacillus alcalophilus]THG90923.1 transcriptional regulator [Alkalihalobacillus alcalophilus ATCC 27647 = CGMCC 1.3604]
MEQSRTRQRKKRSKRKILKSILTLFVLTFVVIGGAIFYSAWKINSTITGAAEPELERGVKSEMRTEAVNPSKDNFSVLLLGDDSRPGETRARTDAMLVATFNKDEKSIILTSIPRDSRVEMVGLGFMDKINHANSRGGLNMTINTVENFLDIPIDYYGYVRFEGLVDVVDALGGIEVDVPFDFTFNEKSTDSYNLQFTEGLQHINGKEALAYSRMRKQDPLGDIGRGQRQQQVIEGIIKQAASFSTITNFNGLMDAIGDNLGTNFSFANLVALHSYAGSLTDIENHQVQGSNATINGVYYLEVDQEHLADLQTRLKQHLEIDGHSLNDPNPFEEEKFEEIETSY